MKYRKNRGVSLTEVVIALSIIA
ncbi:MAG: prepilin-type N-terminal cleavage/methylation domain-containing protein, partial [bacterium]